MTKVFLWLWIASAPFHHVPSGHWDGHWDGHWEKASQEQMALDLCISEAEKLASPPPVTWLCTADAPIGAPP